MKKDDIMPCLHCCDKWIIRCLIDNGKLFWYVYLKGIDDGSINEVWNWNAYAEPEPIFFFGDYSGLPKAFENKMVFKESCSKQSDCFAFFYQVDVDLDYKPIDETKYLVSFQGSVTSNPIRLKMFDALNKCESFGFFPNQKMWWTYEEKEKDCLKKSYLNSISDSKFIMCPKGICLNSIRFFEALRMGRIPVLISDDCKLPLEHKINFDDFIVRVPEKDVENSIEYIRFFMKKNDILKASRQARDVSLKYFNDTEEFLSNF